MIAEQNVPAHLLAVRAEQLRQKRERRKVGVGTNVANGVADLAIPFPEDQLRLLREVSPVSEIVSWLLPYWYRAGQRWVLYDAMPAALIPDSDDVALGGMMTGADFFRIMNGPRPSERPDFADVIMSPISDVQWAMYHQHKVYARPFWVLQGPVGGHQVAFTPQQASYRVQMGLPDAPPKIGELEPCPFDNRAARMLLQMNRLHQMRGSMEQLRKSGSREWAEAEAARMARDVREAECRLVEEQMTPIVDMAMSLVRGQNTRSEHRDQIVECTPGIAARAKDAYDAYKETGDYDAGLKDFTGIKR
ncbi:MAG TPA: hypothetical protein VF178_15705 [Gemmatimonadaceae bacterium]